MKYNLLVALLMSFATLSFGQSTITDGYISYGVDINSDQPMVAMFASGSSLEMAFSGNKSKVVAKVAGSNTVSLIADNGLSKALALMDVMGDKKAVKLDKSNFADAKKQLQNFKNNPQKLSDETKVIEGYTCKKILMKDKESGASIIFYVTDKIQPQGELAKDFMAHFKGFPLGIVVRQGSTTVRLTANKISDKVPSSNLFSQAIPDGYEMSTIKELEEKAKNGGQ